MVLTPRTYESFVDIEQKRGIGAENHEQTNDKVDQKSADVLVKCCIEQPDGSQERSRMAFRAGLWIWDKFPPHRCYWNDRFAIAVACNLPLEKLRLAALCVVTNGALGYFEWNTHSGYNMTRVLELLGIDTQHIEKQYGIGGGIYFYLNEEVRHALEKMFNIPTSGPAQQGKLTPADVKLLTDFRQVYTFAGR